MDSRRLDAWTLDIRYLDYGCLDSGRLGSGRLDSGPLDPGKFFQKFNRLQDEISYLREECKSKNCIIQALLENQKVIQNTVNTRSFDKNTNIHTEPFIIHKKFASIIRALLTKPILTSNSFELLSKYSGNVLEANNILSTEIHNAVKDNKTNNANTSNENRKSAPKNKRNKNDQNKIVTAIVGDSMIKDVYGWELSDRGEGGFQAFQLINDRGYEDLHSASTKM